MAAAFAWQFLTVRYNRQGNWTAMFCTGSQARIPPALSGENIYVYQGIGGYDGQFYHYIAHDPAARQGMANYIDAPRLRYRRILVPALAFVLAAGRPERIDGALIAVPLLFILAGAYWLARYARLHGRSHWWGLGFIFLPAALITLDRLVVDVALAACVIGFALYAKLGEDRKLFAVLVLACLARDTGLLLPAACCLHTLLARRPGRALLWAAAALPALAWFAYIAAAVGAPAAGAGPVSFGAILQAFRPQPYAQPALIVFATRAFDYLALAGCLLGLALALRKIRSALDPAAIAVVLFALLGVFASLVSAHDIWIEAYAYGRVLTPLLALLALGWLRSGERLAVVPLATVTLRTGLLFGSQTLGILHGLVGTAV